MAKKKNKLSKLSHLLLLFAGIYVFDEIFNNTDEPKKMSGIAGLKGSIRKIILYKKKDGVSPLIKEMLALDKTERSEVIGLKIKGRKAIELKMPLFKSFVDTPITGELRSKSGWRIFLYRIEEETFLMTNFFLKQSNGTPHSEILKAEKRIKDYINQLKKP